MKLLKILEIYSVSYTIAISNSLDFIQNLIVFEVVLLLSIHYVHDNGYKDLCAISPEMLISVIV